jgi:hypothetical protein
MCSRCLGERVSTADRHLQFSLFDEMEEFCIPSQEGLSGSDMMKGCWIGDQDTLRQRAQVNWWKRFGPLHVYAPASEYILALKITAGRQKDLDDGAILLAKTKFRTRKQAQQLLDRYILPSGQQKNAESIENALNQLFGREG